MADVVIDIDNTSQDVIKSIKDIPIGKYTVLEGEPRYSQGRN